MINERLDEVVDRVARAMTAVPADPGFSRRVSARLHPDRRAVAAWKAAAAGGVMALSAMAMFWVADGPMSVEHDRTHTANRPASAPGAPTLSPPAATVGTAAAATPARSTSVDPPAFAVSRGADVQSPAADARADEPAALDVAALILPPLTIADVDVTALDIATLEIVDIDSGGEPKEPK
jgi:hypothetical protein